MWYEHYHFSKLPRELEYAPKAEKQNWRIIKSNVKKIFRGRQSFVAQKMVGLLLGWVICEVFMDEKVVKVDLEKWRENSLNLLEVFILTLIKWNACKEVRAESKLM